MSDCAPSRSVSSARASHCERVFAGPIPRGCRLNTPACSAVGPNPPIGTGVGAVCTATCATNASIPVPRSARRPEQLLGDPGRARTFNPEIKSPFEASDTLTTAYPHSLISRQKRVRHTLTLARATLSHAHQTLTTSEAARRRDGDPEAHHEGRCRRTGAT